MHFNRLINYFNNNIHAKPQPDRLPKRAWSKSKCSWLITFDWWHDALLMGFSSLVLEVWESQRPSRPRLPLKASSRS